MLHRVVYVSTDSTTITELDMVYKTVGHVSVTTVVADFNPITIQQIRIQFLP